MQNVDESDDVPKLRLSRVEALLRECTSILASHGGKAVIVWSATEIALVAAEVLSIRQGENEPRSADAQSRPSTQRSSTPRRRRR